VEQTGLTSFQIMPFFNQDMEEFDNKMDQIDTDVMKKRLEICLFHVFV
jgi:hypothetical protein